MRRDVRSSLSLTALRPSTTLAAAALCLWLTGCAHSPYNPDSSQPSPSQTPTAKPAEKSKLADDGAHINDQTADVAQRLADALDRSRSPHADPQPDDPSDPADDDGRVQWVDNRLLKSSPPPKPAAADAGSDAKADDAPSTDEAQPPSAPDPGAATAANDVNDVNDAPARPPVVAPRPQPAELSRAQLLQLLRENVRDGEDPAITKAIAMAGIALADPHMRLDDAALADLPPTQAQLVRQFHRLLTALARQVASGEVIDRQALADQLNTIIGEQPLSIRTAKVCQRVRGYGVYEEMPADLMVGREHPTIVYVELDHFRIGPSDRILNHHEVRLTQELVLYNESDGLAVWRQPAETIVDESRNRRRDFYTVQPTRLPARLGVGKYVLKVTVRDLLGGTRDETSIPIRIIADPSLVKPIRRTDLNTRR